MIESPHDLDDLWAEFLDAGNLDPVRKIAQVLERPDVTRAKLQEWSAAKVFPWSKKRKLKIAARLHDLGLSEASNQDLDLVVWKLMSGGFQVRDELPFSISEDYMRNLCIKGAACWSLQSNATQHATVAEFVESIAALETAPSFID